MTDGEFRNLPHIQRLKLRTLRAPVWQAAFRSNAAHQAVLKTSMPSSPAARAAH